jgi:hypothetical protein
MRLPKLLVTAGFASVALGALRPAGAATGAPLKLDPAARVTGPVLDEAKGVRVYAVESPYLNGKNAVEVLLPDRYDKTKPHRVLYILPVNPGLGGRWGDGLQLARKLDAPNKHGLICVTMAFDTSPWYGAHATDPAIRHEDHLKRVVVPLIEGRYRTRGRAEDRLLLGFSKSGWGAFLLVLRNPGFFGAACSWDAPLMMTEAHFGTFETGRHFGTAEAMARYVPSVWAKRNAEHFRKRKRLVLLGHARFGTRGGKDAPHTEGFHRLLDGLGIPHHYDNTLACKHAWGTDWMGPAIEALAAAGK